MSDPYHLTTALGLRLTSTTSFSSWLGGRISVISTSTAIDYNCTKYALLWGVVSVFIVFSMVDTPLLSIVKKIVMDGQGIWRNTPVIPWLSRWISHYTYNGGFSYFSKVVLLQIHFNIECLFYFFLLPFFLKKRK